MWAQFLVVAEAASKTAIMTIQEKMRTRLQPPLPAADINTARFATKLGAAFGSLGSGAPVLMWQTGAKAVAAFDVTPEDAEVTLTPAAQTAAGEKNVFLLTSGTSYTYTVSASGRADASGALETGSKLYTIELPAAQAYRVWFNVMDKESGEKITGYTVEVKSGDTVCPAGEDGKYSLYAGKYTYTVSASLAMKPPRESLPSPRPIAASTSPWRGLAHGTVQPPNSRNR